MGKDINHWARCCLPCQKSKTGRHNKLPHEHIPIPDSRFSHVHIDIVGLLTQSQGFSYLLTMIDRFTRWPEAIPIRNITADTVATTFYSSWITRFGAPTIITTDQGTQFESLLFKSLAHLVGCQKTRTSPYHPASNGIVERWHRSLKAALMCHNDKTWVDTLPTVLLGIRTSIKEDMGTTAAEMVYGTPQNSRRNVSIGRYASRSTNIRREVQRTNEKNTFYTHSPPYPPTNFRPQGPFHVFPRLGPSGPCEETS